MDKLELIIKNIIAEEMWPKPEIRAAHRLYNIGISEEDILKIRDIDYAVKVKIANTLRDLIVEHD